MPTVFFTSDTHFGHKNIIGFGRQQFDCIEEHDEALIENWNAIVRPTDVVWHLGDVAFGRENIGKAKRLNGEKHLIMGNHDTYSIYDYIGAGFKKIYGVYKKYSFVMTHVPIHEKSIIDRYLWNYNVHGHIHTLEASIKDKHYYNVCCDFHDLKPVALDVVRDIMKSRINV